MVNFINGINFLDSNNLESTGDSFDYSTFQNTQPQQMYQNTGYDIFSQPMPMAIADNSQFDMNSFANGTYQNQNAQYSLPPEKMQALMQMMGMPQQPSTGNYDVSMQDLLNPIGNYLKEINKLTQNVNNIGMKNALNQSQSAYIDAYLEAEATQKILQMNNQSTRSNAILDQQMLALRQNYNIVAKQTEQYVLDAQVREQLTNLFFTLEKTIMDNRFSLAKTVVNSAKY